MEDKELERLRRERLRELQRQQAEQAQAAQDQAQLKKQLEEKKQRLLMQILTSDARIRLTNIRLTRPQLAEYIENQLIVAYGQGALRGQIPLSDEKFKALLIQIQGAFKRREPKIRFR